MEYSHNRIKLRYIPFRRKVLYILLGFCIYVSINESRMAMLWATIKYFAENIIRANIR